MPDNKTKPGPQDAKRINVHEKHEVQYWTETLNVSRERLIEVVELVGTSADAVRKALGQ